MGPPPSVEPPFERAEYMAATIYVAKNAASIMKAFKGQESASLPEVIWIFQLQEDPTIDEYTWYQQQLGHRHVVTGNFEFADKTAFNTEVDTEYFTETFWPQIKGYLVTMMNSALEEFENDADPRVKMLKHMSDFIIEKSKSPVEKRNGDTANIDQGQVGRDKRRRVESPTLDEDTKAIDLKTSDEGGLNPGAQGTSVNSSRRSFNRPNESQGGQNRGSRGRQFNALLSQESIVCFPNVKTYAMFNGDPTDIIEMCLNILSRSRGENRWTGPCWLHWLAFGCGKGSTCAYGLTCWQAHDAESALAFYGLALFRQGKHNKQFKATQDHIRQPSLQGWQFNGDRPCSNSAVDVDGCTEPDKCWAKKDKEHLPGSLMKYRAMAQWAIDELLAQDSPDIASAQMWAALLGLDLAPLAVPNV